MTTTSPRIRVAQHLTAIVDLAERLEEQAINDANDHLMPGGLAMVALATVANLEAWAHKLDAAERQAIESGTSAPAHEDGDDWQPPLQLLLFWSEDLRRTHDQEFEPTPYRPYPTVASEANMIRHHLDWLWENEPHWEDFAEDMRTAVAQLEALLSEGLRPKRGVPCLAVDCDGATLVRPVASRREHRYCDGHDGICTLPHNRCPHDRGGLRDEWTCPSCMRRYGLEDYSRAVAHAALMNADWLTIEDAVNRTGVKRGTIQAWATREHIRRRKDHETGRTLYHVGDIEERHDADRVAL